MNQGWICPRCNTVWSPTVEQCKACKPIAVAPRYALDRTYRPYPYTWNTPGLGSGTVCSDGTTDDRSAVTP
jgi:hypothetical protein